MQDVEKFAEIKKSLSLDLLSIKKWCDINKSVNKCSAMLICCSQKRYYVKVNDFKLTLYDSSIPLVSCIKVLGLYINNNLIHCGFIVQHNI